MSFNDTSATTTINIGALIDTTATSTQNVRSLLAGSVAWSYATVEWFADSTWTPAQITTLNTIFNTWGTVTGITFQQTTVQNDAEVILISDNNTNGFGGYSGIPADVPITANQTFTDGSVVVSQTGQINIHIAPGGFIGSGTTNINIFDAAGNITRGGFELILHEIGHSLGLKHPHNGSTGNSLLWPGVTNVNDLGTNSLNQDLYTLMSYNFQVVPDGAGGNTLYTMATPMAYDIAAIQLLYGANTTFNSGDTTYDLATPAAASQWTSIWDTGGTDEIIYLGTNASTIDLRSATLDGTVGSGGYLSYFTFADGRTSAGFTIAGDIRNVLGDVGTEHGVIIENARTGSGNDEITGNAVDNELFGNGGADALTGMDGNDFLDGGEGGDTAIYSGTKSDYTTSLLSSSSIQIIDNRAGSPDGTDTNMDIEFFVFSDGTFTLAQLNQPPVASADSNGVAKGSTLNIPANVGVLANDTDPDVFDQSHLQVSAVTGLPAGQSVAGTYGSLSLNSDGSYVYVAKHGNLPSKIVAQDVFEYTVTDNFGSTDTAQLYIVVFNPGVSYQAGINTILIGGNRPDVLDGSAGNCELFGGNGPDVLIGGNGDTLTGERGPDTYLFRPEFGTNTITDFDTHNDNMQFDKSIFTSAADILANHTTDTAAGAVISDGLGDEITLLGVHQSQLSAAMFMLA